MILISLLVLPHVKNCTPTFPNVGYKKNFARESRFVPPPTFKTVAPPLFLRTKPKAACEPHCLRLAAMSSSLSLCATMTSRVRSKLKVQNSGTFQRLLKNPNCIFQAPKLSTKSHILDADIQNLDCNVTLKCTALYSTIPK